MKKNIRISFATFFSGLLLVAGTVMAKHNQYSPVEGEPYSVSGQNSPPANIVWIADWNFDGAGCNNTGWVKYDNRILNDGSNYWSVNASFSGTGGIANQAAVLAKHDLSWVRDGCGNNWDYSIICKYQGAGATLSFDYLSDSEPGFDFVAVEADSAGVSDDRVDYVAAPGNGPAAYREVLLTWDGLQNGTVTSLGLPDFGVPLTTHEVYIRFASDCEYSDEDGLYPTTWNAGLIVDNIAVTGALAYTESFEAVLNANVSFVNTAPATPFGEWARLYSHITDNDVCTQNTTCAWLFTDPLRTAAFPDMAFGPGSNVIHNWLDDIIVSPWVSLASTPSAGTVIYYRRFPGNDFGLGRIVQNWSVRSKVRIDNTDTPSPGDSIDAVTPWAHCSDWNSLTLFSWITSTGDMSSYIAPASTEIQVRFRQSDWQWIGNSNYYGFSSGHPFNPGPGAFTDQVRIGRRVLSGPVFSVGIDVRSQAQDCFATVLNSIMPGEHFDPATDIWGSCAFSRGTELTINAKGPNLVTGDSVSIRVSDVRGAGGVNAVRWYGAIVSGPHQGKAPSPYTVGSNGFFEVTPDNVRSSSGSVIADQWFVDLDDTYFRGGDVLLYFWTALDAGGARSSFPDGITAANFPPASVSAAELATGGLVEVSFLPTINWDPTYLAAIAADPNGDIDPTQQQIDNSSQKNCILYYAAGFGGGDGRRSGAVNQTSFMFTLDRLGYSGHYDVYDHQGYGNTNNQLGGRANVSQCSGYALIIHDTGRGTTPNIPDGIDIDAEKINQCQWYRDYLAQGLTSAAGISNLWLIGEDNAFEKQANPLISTDVGLAAVVTDQGLNVNPTVKGQVNFTFSNGNIGAFASDEFILNGGCPAIRDYDGAGASGGTITHRYTFGATTGTGAIIMNKNNTLHWNTIWMGFGWFDIQLDPPNPPPSTVVALKILNAVLAGGCIQSPTDVGDGDPTVDAVPAVSALHQNVPNPFNPTTTIKFDLARDGQVRLQVFDVAGHLIKTLVNGNMNRGYNQKVTWNGLDDGDRRVPSGVYFYQLVTDELTATKKMVMLR